MSATELFNIVAVGGGTGLSTLLRGLKHYVKPAEVAVGSSTEGYALADLTAIVTVADDGGSSGRLREEFQILPPGDIRNCMVALSEHDNLLARLFDYRFPGQGALGGHSLGNLFLTALTSLTGRFAEAIRCSSELLGAKGRIFPSTAANVRLAAELDDGTPVRGQHNITNGIRPVRMVRLEPADCLPLKGALEAIRQADLIVIGPGSLFTSLIPNLLVRGISEAIIGSPAKKIYICNIMTQRGETNGYGAEDHVRHLLAHCPGLMLDSVLLNIRSISEAARRKYRADGAEQVRMKDPKGLQTEAGIGFMALGQGRPGIPVLCRDLLEEAETVRHHPAKLGSAVLDAWEWLAQGQHPHQSCRPH
ncbi:MAG: YvcK family protein [Desulfobacterales bacterium]|nr:YvcK family protein [Desulfobacterales bacterium]